MKKITKRRIAAPFLSIVPLLVMPAFMFLSIALIAIISPTVKLSPDGTLENDILMLIAELFAAAAAILFSYAVVKSFSKVSLKEVFIFKGFDLSVPIMLTLFVRAASALCNHAAGLVLSGSMSLEHDDSEILEIRLYSVISAIVIAPIAEEIMCRFTGCELGRRIYSVPIICTANGLLFAVCHGYKIQGFISVFIGGVCAAYVYCKTRNILYTMLEHALHNAIVYLPLGDTYHYEKNGFSLYRWWYLLINAVIIAGCIVWYIKVFRKKYTENYFKVCIQENIESIESEEAVI